MHVTVRRAHAVQGIHDAPSALLKLPLIGVRKKPVMGNRSG